MKNLIQKSRFFLADQSGVTSVEYAVLLALIIGACIIGVTAVGSATADHMDASKDVLNSALENSKK